MAPIATGVIRKKGEALIDLPAKNCKIFYASKNDF
jgi:hypothetical protein